MQANVCMCSESGAVLVSEGRRYVNEHYFGECLVCDYGSSTCELFKTPLLGASLWATAGMGPEVA